MLDEKKTRILITGGAGFIGSNLYNKLIQNPNNIIDVVDDMSSGNLSHLDITLDFDDYFYHMSFDSRQIIENIKQKKYDIVYHLAALPSVPYSIENPYKTFDTNVTKTIKLLEACRGNVKKFIFASSCAVYGSYLEFGKNGISENHETSPSNPYALQKLNVEEWIECFVQNYDLKEEYIIYRFFNVYGPNQTSNNAYANVISSWMKNAKQNHPLRLDGDGTQRRDFVFVDDVVDILERTIQKNFTPYHTKLFNIGSGTSYSCNEVLDFMKKKYPNNLKIVNAPKRAGDIENIVANTYKLSKLFPDKKFLTLEEGLEKTFKWWNTIK